MSGGGVRAKQSRCGGSARKLNAHVSSSCESNMCARVHVCVRVCVFMCMYFMRDF